MIGKFLSSFRKKKRRESTPDARIVRAKFDNAQTTTDNANHWAQADSYDADSANSKAVRETLTQRSRYEGANNGYLGGMYRTHATYVVRSGPMLQMRTNIPGFNQAVEQTFKRWAKAIKLRRKLWCAAHAKVQDGEPFLIFKTNSNIRHPVKLDVQLLEAEYCQSPLLQFQTAGYIDGIKFDSFGNPEWYDILPQHPGGQWSHFNMQPMQVPARFVGHWFTMERPGQHRGIPECHATLGVGSGSRRFREATLAAAETAADIAALIKTQGSPDDGADEVAPFTTLEFQKRMMTMLPMGWDATQMRAEHPGATYEMFNRAQVSELGRPKSIPHNLGACDSSDHNFASGKLDFTPYYLEVDNDRLDCEDLILDEPLFALWWAEAVNAYGWNGDPENPPDHSWSWDLHPIADAESAALAARTRLQSGQTTLSAVYEEAGGDFDDEVERMASDYGVSVDKIKEVLLAAVFSNGNAIASMSEDASLSDSGDDVSAINRLAAILKPNGNGTHQ